jgi:hypothetical protein
LFAVTAKRRIRHEHLRVHLTVVGKNSRRCRAGAVVVPEIGRRAADEPSLAPDGAPWN